MRSIVIFLTFFVDVSYGCPKLPGFARIDNLELNEGIESVMTKYPDCTLQREVEGVDYKSCSVTLSNEAIPAKLFFFEANLSKIELQPKNRTAFFKKIQKKYGKPWKKSNKQNQIVCGVSFDPAWKWQRGAASLSGCKINRAPVTYTYLPLEKEKKRDIASLGK